MARKVREQDVDHVVVKGDMVHITIVVISQGILQTARELNTMTREMGLKATRISWGRVAAAAVLSEVAVVLVIVLISGAYRLLIAPGRTAAEYAAFSELAGSYAAPAAAGLTIFCGALWVCRKLTSGFIANGTAVGIIAVVLSGGLLFTAKPEDRFLYGVSLVLRILGGYAGGVFAQRRSGQRLVSVPTVDAG